MSVKNLYELFEENAEKFPKKTALVYLGHKVSFNQLRDFIEGFAAGLYTLGLSKASKCIIYLPNIPQWIISWLALQKLGSVAVPIPHIYTPYELKYISNDCGAEAIICMDTNFGYVTEIMPETGLKKIVTTTMGDMLPWWQRLIGKAFDRFPSGKIVSGHDIFPFKRLLKGGAASLQPLMINGGEICEILYTSGTTGHPKGVPISLSLFLENGIEHRKVSEPLVPMGEGIVLQGSPLYHILGQAFGLVPLCMTGDTLILKPRVNLDAYFESIQKYKVSLMSGVPALYRAILEHDRLNFYDLSSLQYCMIGGDVVPVEVLERWEKKFKKVLSESYGTTETCGGVAMINAAEKAPKGSTGKVVRTKDVRLVDPNTLDSVPDGEPGELLVSSKHMVTSYWNNPDETKKCFVNIEGKIWYRTGDIVRIDKDGWVFFTDRSGDIIKHKGYRVSASEIEQVLQEHPAVMACCVSGVSDPRVGERIKAFVVLKENVKGVSGYDLIAYCRKRLASYKVPGYIEFRDTLPKSKVGKLLRRELRAEEKRRVEN
ncbi:class I adenylate-forming enzyme family protein [Desulfatiglans anilini]|uniref:class I adenylate-forming enzyme family protein n=1 Tax=Desulfatiglans anilini TaxID=90728 RepID=UPI00040F06CE|nr:AMP-binding protein [Desulfatiglans anilini]